jgi:CHAD domain-containing protein
VTVEQDRSGGEGGEAPPHTRLHVLVGGPEPVRAPRIELPPGATVDAFLAAVTDACLQHLVANEPAAVHGSDPEGVHQMRVAARRMRAALGLFAGVVPERQRGALREELRWLAGELGPARDLDVLGTELLAPIVAARPGDAGLARLRGAADSLRAEAQARALAALQDPRHRSLVRELGAWIASRGWREQSSVDLLAPARPWAAALLERRQRGARALGRRLAACSPEERHRLRIRLKKLRYVAEYAGALHAGRRTERYVRRLARLQDALGHLNDVALAEQRLVELAERLGPNDTEARRAAGFAAGWLAHSAQRELERLPRRWRRFEEAGRFWDRGER